MFLQSLLKKRNVSQERTHGQICEDLGKAIDGAAKDCLNIAGISLIDLDIASIADTSDKEMLIGKRLVTVCGEAMKLLSEKAALADRQEKIINELDSKVNTLNEELLKTNEMLTKLCESMS